jgi:hypothetical protein
MIDPNAAPHCGVQEYEARLTSCYHMHGALRENHIGLLDLAAEGLKRLPTISCTERVAHRVLWLHVAKQYLSLHGSVMVVKCL